MPPASLAATPSMAYGSSCRMLHRQRLTCRPRTLVVNQAKGFGTALGFGKKPISNRPPLTPGKVAPMSIVPANIPKPPYADSGAFPAFSDRHQIHDAKGIEKMRASGLLAARVLQMAGAMVKPGVCTDEIDKAVHKMVTEAGAYPSPLNYGKFPKSVCTSVNECVCHGIPDDRPLQDGDIVNIDVTVFLNGYHGDTSAMFFVGTPSPEAKKLVDVTKKSLDEAIKICAPGVPYKMIGQTIHAIADKNKLGVIKEYTGHGVGTVFHSAPTIMHNRNNAPGVMKLGQTFTIEPMLVQGDTGIDTWRDNWTVVTKDRGLAAQFEHTLLIVEGGVEVLTKIP